MWVSNQEDERAHDGEIGGGFSTRRGQQDAWSSGKFDESWQGGGAETGHRAGRAAPLDIFIDLLAIQTSTCRGHPSAEHHKSTIKSTCFRDLGDADPSCLGSGAGRNCMPRRL